MKPAFFIMMFLLVGVLAYAQRTPPADHPAAGPKNEIIILDNASPDGRQTALETNERIVVENRDSVPPSSKPGIVAGERNERILIQKEQPPKKKE